MKTAEQENIKQLLSTLSTQDKLELIAFLRALHKEESSEEMPDQIPNRFPKMLK